jgi:hypothetical protein
MEFYWPMHLGLDKTSTGTKASGNALIDSQPAGKTQYPKSLSSQPSVVETRLDTTQGAAGDDNDEVTGGLKHKPNQQYSYAESSP